MIIAYLIYSSDNDESIDYYFLKRRNNSATALVIKI